MKKIFLLIAFTGILGVAVAHEGDDKKKKEEAKKEKSCCKDKTAATCHEKAEVKATCTEGQKAEGKSCCKKGTATAEAPATEKK
ncbi:MAG: hypothetical protein K0S44_1617 [Bacteroidetes bacterium]|jgi:hypothetical protein|nr:hypothetical protein [Bacteroidota bacterium]